MSSPVVSQSGSPVHGRAEKLQSDEPRDCGGWADLVVYYGCRSGLGFVGIAWTSRERALTRPQEELPIRPLLTPQRSRTRNSLSWRKSFVHHVYVYCSSHLFGGYHMLRDSFQHKHEMVSSSIQSRDPRLFQSERLPPINIHHQELHDSNVFASCNSPFHRHLDLQPENMSFTRGITQTP
jgi:hypothetical protein